MCSVKITPASLLRIVIKLGEPVAVTKKNQSKIASNLFLRLELVNIH
ncbi:hypothetical protein [Azospirillum doebereinerae]